MTAAPQGRSIRAQQKVLESAAQLMAGGGFENARVSTISKMSGVSVGSVYHHFESKTGIFRQLIQQAYDVSRQQLSNIEPEGRDLDGVLHQFVEMICMHICRNLGLYRSMIELTKSSPEVWEPFRKLRVETEKKLCTALAPTLRQGGFSDAEYRIGLMHQTLIATLTHAAIFDSGPIHVRESEPKDEEFLLAKSILLADNLKKE